MWMYTPQRWYEVPGWLWRVWTAGRAKARPGDAKPTEAPPRVTATAPRPAIAESVERIRRQVDRMWPENCCVKQPMVAGGKRSMVCSDDCPWCELDLLVANASIDA